MAEASSTTRPPSIDTLLARPAMTVLVAGHGRAAVLGCARLALSAWRDAKLKAFDVLAFEQHCAAQLARDAALHLRPVINMTGTWAGPWRPQKPLTPWQR
jgi:L-seryl-tRNA(Ser) seleniumtransferase